MKLTKKQKEIYNWLLEHPGYLKKSVNYILDKGITRDCEIALKEARIDYKIHLENTKITKFSKVLEKSIELVKSDKKVDFKLERGKVNKNYFTPGKYIIIGCPHVPFHRIDMFNGVYKLLEDNKSSIVGLILAGDFLDMNSLSSHDKGKKPLLGVSLDWEYKEGNMVLDNLLKPLAKDITKVYIYGNHEDRYNRYMSDIDNSKLGASLPSPTIALKLIERGFNVYENWKLDFVTLGNFLDVSHGEFFNIHTAKKHIDTYRRSMLYYHTHRIQQYIEGQVGGYNGGSLADFDSPVFSYASRAMKTSWLNGFNTVDVDKDGYYHLQQIMCYNNKFVYGSKTYNF